jgi:hypothetical protein
LIDASFDRMEVVLPAKIDASKVEAIRRMGARGVTMAALFVSRAMFGR